MGKENLGKYFFRLISTFFTYLQDNSEHSDIESSHWQPYPKIKFFRTLLIFIQVLHPFVQMEERKGSSEIEKNFNYVRPTPVFVSHTRVEKCIPQRSKAEEFKIAVWDNEWMSSFKEQGKGQCQFPLTSSQAASLYNSVLILTNLTHQLQHAKGSFWGVSMKETGNKDEVRSVTAYRPPWFHHDFAFIPNANVNAQIFLSTGKVIDLCIATISHTTFTL